MSMKHPNPIGLCAVLKVIFLFILFSFFFLRCYNNQFCFDDFLRFLFGKKCLEGNFPSVAEFDILNGLSRQTPLTKKIYAYFTISSLTLLVTSVIFIVFPSR